MTKTTVKLDTEKCDRRRRIAALRDNVDATRVTLLPSGIRPANDERLRVAVGELPYDDYEALYKINLSVEASSGKPLSLDDVYIHYIEAANTNFISDRYMFLDESTLKNISTQGEKGVAFMNSHRTGGLSAPAELPYGRTFAGRYEEYSQPDGSISKRALLGVYMLRGKRPNGPLAPSTDDLHESIQSGTLTDVSVGLSNEGSRVCNVCAKELGESGCKHVPGTHSNMSSDDIQAQKGLGVRDGKASYSVKDSTIYEVSAVYKGAVPGAGFRKAITFAKSGGLGACNAEALAAYGDLMDPSEKALFGVASASKGRKAMGFDFLSWLKLGQSVGAIDAEADLSGLENVQATPVVKAPAPVSVIASAPAESLAVSSDERAAFEKEKRDLKRDQFGVQADSFLLQLKTANKITPAEEPSVKRGYVLAAMDDHFNPLPDEDGKPVSRLEIFKSAQLGRVNHGLTTEEITTAEVLPTGEVPDESNGTPAERLASLLRGTQLGQEIVTALTSK